MVVCLLDASCSPVLACVQATCADANSLAAQGFAVQSYVTGEGPYANWAKHVSDPFGYNLLTILSGEDRVPTL